MKKQGRLAIGGLASLIGLAGCMEPGRNCDMSRHQQYVRNQQRQQESRVDNNQQRQSETNNYQQRQQDMTKGETMTLIGLGAWGLGLGTPGGADLGRSVFNAGLSTVAAEQNKSDVQQNVYVDGQQEQKTRQLSKEWGYEIMKHIHDNKISTFFVCNDIFDFGNNGVIDPEDYIGIEKYSYSKNERITIGSIIWENKGAKIFLRILKPSGKSLEYDSIIPQREFIGSFYIPNEEKEVGRNTLVGYLDGKYLGKVEFDITE